MADPKEEKTEKELDEPAAPKPSSELSETELEKASGGYSIGTLVNS